MPRGPPRGTRTRPGARRRGAPDADRSPRCRTSSALRSRDRERVVRGAVAGRRAAGVARAARHPVAGLGRGRRARDSSRCEGRRRAGRRARRRADRSEPGLRRPAPARARVLGLRVPAGGRRPDARRSTTCGSRSAARRRRSLAAIVDKNPQRPHRRASGSSRSCCARSPSAVRCGKAVGCSTVTCRRAVAARRVRPRSRRREPRPRVHAAVAGAAARAAADRVSQPADRRQHLGNGARVSRRRAAGADPRAAVAVSRAAARRAAPSRPRDEVDRGRCSARTIRSC